MQSRELEDSEYLENLRFKTCQNETSIFELKDQILKQKHSQKRREIQQKLTLVLNNSLSLEDSSLHSKDFENSNSKYNKLKGNTRGKSRDSGVATEREERLKYEPRGTSNESLASLRKDFRNFKNEMRKSLQNGWNPHLQSFTTCK